MAWNKSTWQDVIGTEISKSTVTFGNSVTGVINTNLASPLKFLNLSIRCEVLFGGSPDGNAEIKVYGRDVLGGDESDTIPIYRQDIEFVTSDSQIITLPNIDTSSIDSLQIEVLNKDTTDSIDVWVSFMYGYIDAVAGSSPDETVKISYNDTTKDYLENKIVGDTGVIEISVLGESLYETLKVSLNSTKLSNWDSAYGWGDHSVEGYLKSFIETDPIFSAWLAYPPALSEFINDVGYLTAETDPDFNSWLSGVTPANWDSAYGWGDHSIQGYLKSFIEVDPVFMAWLSYPPAISEFINDLGYLTAETDPDFNSWLSGVTPANWDSAYGWGDHSIQGYLKSFTETDPIFSAWLSYPPALSEFTNDLGYLIAETDPDFNSWLGTVTPANWDSAYGWGDHSIQGYLKSFIESDPVFIDWLSYPPSLSEFTNDLGYLTAETDPDFNSWLGGVTPANWDSAYGWGDHSIQGYLKSYIETDPVFTDWLSYPPSLSEFTNDLGYLTAETDPDFNSWLSGVTPANWDSAYGWGDHSIQGYLKSFIESDPVFIDWLSYPPALSEFTNDLGYLIAETDPDFNSWLGTVTPANWDSAYGWGDHSVEGYLKSYIETDPVFTDWLNYPPALSEFTNDVGYLTAETDPDFNSWLGGVTPANWDSAYGWGDHSIQGYLKSYVETDPIFSAWLSYPPALSEFTNDMSFITAETDPDFNSWLGGVTPANWDSAYGWGDHSIQGYLKSFTETDPIFSAWLSYPPSLSEFTNDMSFITAETDPDFNSWLGGVTPANWDSAYGWGDHSIQGYIKSFDDYYQERLILAEEFQNPNNADWVVNVLAPLSADDNNNGLNVRLFDDTANEGIGFDIFIPSFATNIVLKFKSRAITAPAGTKKVDLGLYFRSIPDNAAVDAWSAKKNITGIISIPTNEYFQYDTTTISLATLGITSNRYTQFEIIRDAADEANDDLVGDWALLSMIVSFT